VMRNTVDMPSVAVLLVALVGGTMLGLAGAVMAIPVAAAVKVLMSPAIAALDEPDPSAASTLSGPTDAGGDRADLGGGTRPATGA
jgi:hypothetical protein